MGRFFVHVHDGEKFFIDQYPNLHEAEVAAMQYVAQRCLVEITTNNCDRVWGPGSRSGGW